MANDEIYNGMAWRLDAKSWLLILFSLFLSIVIYYQGLEWMVNDWINKEEYGHGFLIPVIVIFLLWQKSDILEKTRFTGSWLGVFLVFIGLLLYFMGELSALYVIIQYGFLVVLLGLALTYTGSAGFRKILIPLIMLIFMIPLPNFLLFTLSSQLQLISSQIGVALIRLFDISVFLEGNVIDLGQMKLQVVEACSGLNYLFPLMTLGFIAANFFNGLFWKKAIIFLSTIPVTVLMNSFRIGAIGITVEFWGQEMAEGFLHDFEGWIVFMACIGILLIEMWILSGIGKDKMPLREAFGLDFPAPTPKDAEIRHRKIGAPFIASVVLLFLVALSSVALPEREDIIPERQQFSEYPLAFDGWSGRKGYLEQIYIDALKFNDYAMYDYVNGNGSSVNFYSAYYDSQRKGASAHSPRACIPGGGWRIAEFSQIPIDNTQISGKPLIVNRLVISLGDTKQLVYYWFQQRGRIITNEYLVKWYLFWDAITKSRTDGALVRLTTMIERNGSIEDADKRLNDFAHKISPILPDYIPN